MRAASGRTPGRVARGGLGAAGFVALVGCASGPSADALKNKVFYQYDVVGKVEVKTVEVRYPPLDLGGVAPLPEYVGVSVLGGAVHLSRPTSWVIRASSTQAAHRYVEYVSPSEYMVAIYELVDSPEDPWLDVMSRFEDSAAKAGADLVGGRVPMATWNAQGRGYVLRRVVPGAKAPFVNYSHEYLLRSDHRLVLVQIVHHEEKLDQLGAELRRTLDTLQLD